MIYDANQISIEDDTDISFSEDVGQALRGLRLGRRRRRLAQERRRRRPTSRTSTRSSRRSRQSKKPERPRSSSSTRSSPGPPRPSRTPASRTAPPSATTRSPPPRSSSASTRRSPSRSTAPCSPTPARSRRAARPPTRRGTSGMPRGARPTPSAPSCSTAWSPASCRRAWTRRCPSSRPTPRRAWPPARPRARCSPRSPTSCPSCGAARPTSPSPTTRPWRAPSPSSPTRKQTREWKGGPYGRTLHFGVREHGMGMILNGIALEGLTRPYGGTFLVFSDYMRPAVRLAAIQQLPVTFVWTHDSIGLGEDGPTHQPIEHLAALRAIPGLDVIRPADANETAAAWGALLEAPRPAGGAGPDPPGRARLRPQGVRQGQWRRQGRLHHGRGLHGSTPDVILIATGSEVQLAVEAREHPREAGRLPPAWSSDAVPRVVRPADRGLPREGPAPRRPRPCERRGRRLRRAGASSSATPVRSSASTTTARPPTSRRSSRSSASPPRRSSRPPRGPSRPRRETD